MLLKQVHIHNSINNEVNAKNQIILQGLSSTEEVNVNKTYNVSFGYNMIGSIKEIYIKENN